MKLLSRIGVILTLSVLFIGISVGVASAAYGDNMITNPSFTSLGPSSSSDPYYWKYSLSGSGTGTIQSVNGAYISITSTTSGSYYAYIQSTSKINLKYVSQIQLTNTYSSGTIQSIGAQYSSDGSTWNSFTQSGSAKTGTLTWTKPSSLTESYYIRFYVSTASINTQLKTTFSNAKAIDVSQAPVFSSATTPASPIEIGGSVSTTVTYTEGYPAIGAITVTWGDGTTSVGANGATFSHTYNSVGDFAVTCIADNGAYVTTSSSIGTVQVSPKITGADTNPAMVSGVVTVSPGSAVSFQAYYQGAVSTDANAYTWYVKESQSSAVETPGGQIYQHTFTTAGTYQVKVKVKGTNGVYSSYYTIGTVSVGTNTVSFDETTYTSGDTARISWTLNNPDYSQSYTLQVFESDSTGVTSGTSILNPVAISSGMSYYDWSTSNKSGYFVAKIFKSTDVVATSSVATIETIGTLYVTITKSSATWTNTTYVNLIRDGTTYANVTTTSGYAEFTNVRSGIYTVTASTDGYATQTATIQMVGAVMRITIDFINGASTSQEISGAGSMYSVTYVTFRVIDKNTGATVPGAIISGSAFAATNPVEWLVNWFGGAFGNSVIGTNITGTSDDNGVVSFVMYPNLRYSLKLEHSGLSEPSTRTFSPSSLSAEYPWYVEFPKSEEGTTKNIKVTVNVTDTGLIQAHYQDLTKSTSTVVMTAYSKDDNNKYNVTMGSVSGGGNDFNLPDLQLTDYSGKDVKIVVTSQTTAYGTVNKVFYHTFTGPWLNLGLPNDIYIWICLFTAILIGGVATFINSYAACFIICFFEWMYWFFGWFFQIGQLVVLPLLILATVMSVLYYMQSRK